LELAARLRFLVRLLAPSASRPLILPSVRSLAKSVGVDLRNPKWTSYGALEVDVFLSVVGPLATLEFVHDLNVSPPHVTDSEAMAEARELFNGERCWEAHEVLEGLWRQKHGEEKRFIQGVILVCAAFVHHQKGQDDVAFGVLSRAAKQLTYPKPRYLGLDVATLEQNVLRVLTSRGFSNFHI